LEKARFQELLSIVQGITEPPTAHKGKRASGIRWQTVFAATFKGVLTFFRRRFHVRSAGREGQRFPLGRDESIMTVMDFINRRK